MSEASTQLSPHGTDAISNLDALFVAEMGSKVDDTAPAVSAKEVRKSYVHQGRVLEVLKGIDLEIGRGEMLAIVGPSGAGKSTLLHCIGTLDLPSSGTLAIRGFETTHLSSQKLAKLRNVMIGFVFQFHHLLPEFTAIENVFMPGLIHGIAREKLEPRAKELLAEVGLADRGTHRPGELSGGEQQRVALARALMLRPKLLLADEPTGNLDSKTSEQMHNLFFEINRTHGTTIVVVTHNPSLAEQMPRVVGLRDGRVETDRRTSASLDASS